MLGQRNVWQLLLGVASLILLAAAGYATVSGLSSLDDINQDLTTLTEDLGSALQGVVGTEVDEPEVSPPVVVEEPEVGAEAEVEGAEPVGDAAPTVDGHSPTTGSSDVALDATINISFTEDVTLAEGWFEITCSSSGDHPASASGGAQNYVLDPEADFSHDETCTVRVLAAKVADTADPPNNMASDYEFTFTTVAATVEEPPLRGAAEESIEVLLPSSDDMLVLSSEHPEIQIRLENVISATENVTLTNVQVQLLVPKRSLAGDGEEALDSTYVISATQIGYTIPMRSGVNVTLRLDEDNLPPTGDYKAWLIVTSDNGKPRTKELTLEVVSEFQDTPGAESLKFVLPSSDALFINSGREGARSVRIGLRSLKKSDTLTISAAELLIVKIPRGSDGRTLTPAYDATAGGLPLQIEPGEVAYITFTFDKLPTSGSYKAWLLATPEQDKPVWQEVDVHVASLLPEDNQSSVKVHIPSGSGSALVLSHHAPVVQIRMENLENYEITADIQLIVAQKIEGTNTTTPLTPGYASQVATHTLAPTQAINVDLRFDGEESRVPPSGQYQAWLLVTSEKGKLLAETFTLTVSAEPQDHLRHRLTGEPAKAITIGGVRCWPKALDWLFSWKALKWLNWCRNDERVKRINWDGYELALWEESLRENPEFEVIGSELASDKDGRSGWLDADRPDSLQSDRAAKVTLEVADVTSPGEYKGNVSLVAPNSDQKVETIDVTVRLRDHLVWPFLTILIGALLVRWAVLHFLGDADRNIAFQQYLIALARERLENTDAGKGFEKIVYADIEVELDKAELALRVNDFQKARECLREANVQIDRLVEVEIMLKILEENRDKLEPTQKQSLEQAKDHYKRGEIEVALQTLKPLQRKYVQEADESVRNIMVLRPAKDAAFFRPPDPFPVKIDERFQFELSDSDHAQVQWYISRTRPISVKGIVWEIGCWLFRRTGRPKYSNQEYRPERKGRFRLVARFTDGSATRTTSLMVEADRDPVGHHADSVKWSSRFSVLAWAFIAATAGMLYIDARVPTFGAPLDYFFALAWAFGVSSIAEPTEGIIGNLLKQLSGKKKKVKLPTAGQLTGKSQEAIRKEFEGKKVNLVFEPKDGTTFKEYKTTPPAEGIDEGSTVTIVLEPPKSAPVKTKVKLPEAKDLETNDQEAIRNKFKGKKVNLVFEPKDGTTFKEYKDTPPPEGVDEGSIVTIILNPATSPVKKKVKLPTAKQLENQDQKTIRQKFEGKKVDLVFEPDDGTTFKEYKETPPAEGVDEGSTVTIILNPAPPPVKKKEKQPPAAEQNQKNRQSGTVGKGNTGRNAQGADREDETESTAPGYDPLTGDQQ